MNGRIMTSPIEIEGAEAVTEVDEKAEPKRSEQPEKLAGRSPGQLMWRRFKRDAQVWSPRMSCCSSS